MSAILHSYEQLAKAKLAHGFFEDWYNFVTGDLWTPLTTDSSSAATLVLCKTTTGGAGGILSITQDATDNDEIYFGTTQHMFKIAANKPCYMEHRQQYSEGATDDNNVMVGFLSTKAANSIIDDGAGPVASATMAVIYKVDGGTVWRVRSQIGAAVGQTDTVTRHTAGGSSYQTLGVEILPYSSTNAHVIYTLDGQQMEDANGNKIKHDLVYTNAVEMMPFFGVKNGSATAEVYLADYTAAYQVR
jgi:hypothetical protein